MLRSHLWCLKDQARLWYRLDLTRLSSIIKDALSCSCAFVYYASLISQHLVYRILSINRCRVSRLIDTAAYLYGRHGFLWCTKGVKSTDTGAPVFFIDGPIKNCRWTDKNYRRTDKKYRSDRKTEGRSGKKNEDEKKEIDRWIDTNYCPAEFL